MGHSYNHQDKFAHLCSWKSSFLQSLAVSETKGRCLASRSVSDLTDCVKVFPKETGLGLSRNVMSNDLEQIQLSFEVT